MRFLRIIDISVECGVTFAATLTYWLVPVSHGHNALPEEDSVVFLNFLQTFVQAEDATPNAHPSPYKYSHNRRLDCTRYATAIVAGFLKLIYGAESSQ